MLVENIFVYHLDYEVQKLYNLTSTYYDVEEIASMFEFVFRLAYLLSKGNVYVPASNYFESMIGYNLINRLVELNRVGKWIVLLSSSGNIETFLEKKKTQHFTNFSNEIYNYKKLDSLTGEEKMRITMQKRDRSATQDIIDELLDFDGNKLFWKKIHKYSKYNNKSVEEYWVKIKKFPEKMKDKAYISDYLIEYLDIKDKHKKMANVDLNEFITKAYINSFCKEFPDVAFITDLPFISSARLLSQIPKENFISYEWWVTKLEKTKYRDGTFKSFIADCDAEELKGLKYSSEWRLLLESSHVETSDIDANFLEDDLKEYHELSTKKHKIDQRYCLCNFIVKALWICVFIVIFVVAYLLWQYSQEKNTDFIGLLSFGVGLLNTLMGILFKNMKWFDRFKRFDERKFYKKRGVDLDCFNELHDRVTGRVSIQVGGKKAMFRVSSAQSCEGLEHKNDTIEPIL